MGCLGPGTGTSVRGHRRHHRGHRPLVRGLPRHAQNPLAPGLLRPNPHQSISLYRPDSPIPLLSRSQRCPTDRAVTRSTVCLIHPLLTQASLRCPMQPSDALSNQKNFAILISACSQRPRASGLNLPDFMNTRRTPPQIRIPSDKVTEHFSAVLAGVPIAPCTQKGSGDAHDRRHH